MSSLDHELRETWLEELAAIENLHPEITTYGFRASCVRNWALQHDYQLPSVKSSIRPSKRQIAGILLQLGYHSGNQSFNGFAERIYFKKSLARWVGGRIDDLYVFIRGEWILERDVAARNFQSRLGDYFKIDLANDKDDRADDAEYWAQGQITEKRAEDLKQRLIDRAYSKHVEYKTARGREDDAADRIRAALVEASKRWNVNDKERFDHEFELALKRWRTAFVLGDHILPEEAIRPESRRKESLLTYADNQRLKLSSKDNERGGSDYGFKWE